MRPTDWADEVTVTTREGAPARSRSSSRLVSRNGARWLTARTHSSPSSVTRRRRMVRPALLTRTWSRSVRSWTCSASRWTCAREDRSASITSTPWLRRCQLCCYWPTIPTSSFCARLREYGLEERALGVPISGDILLEYESERPLQARIRARDLSVTAEVVPDQDELLPAGAGRLHNMDVVSPWTGGPFPEQHLARQPRLVFSQVCVAQRLERLGAAGACFGQAADSDQQIDDRLGGQTGHSGASHMFDGEHHGPEDVLQPRSLLLEQGGPGRVVVADHDPSSAVSFHAGHQAPYDSATGAVTRRREAPVQEWTHLEVPTTLALKWRNTIAYSAGQAAERTQSSPPGLHRGCRLLHARHVVPGYYWVIS